MANSVVSTNGLKRIANLIINDSVYGAVGTGSTAPVASDTTLETETARNIPSKAFATGKVFQVRNFFGNADLPATVEEVGWFLNATATPDDGQLLVRALLNFTKATDDLTIILLGEVQQGV